MLRRYLAEGIGTFVLVLAGVGSAVLAGDRIGYLGIAAAFALAQLVMVYAIGPISGCHINPAVTLGAWIAKRIPSHQVAWYMLAQIVGGVLAAGLVLGLAKAPPGVYDAGVMGLAANGYGAHSPGHYPLWAALVAEIVLTAVFVLVVLAATDTAAAPGFAGLTIGLALLMVHLVGIPITNMSVNPARSIASAVWAQGWAVAQLWLFVIAPLIGGALAATVYGVVWGMLGRIRKVEDRKGEMPPASGLAGGVR